MGALFECPPLFKSNRATMILHTVYGICFWPYSQFTRHNYCQNYDQSDYMYVERHAAHANLHRSVTKKLSCLLVIPVELLI